MLSGASIVQRQIVRNLRCAAQQSQPCGVDLTLRRVLAWNSPGALDFDNSRRQAADTFEMRFSSEAKTTSEAAESIFLSQGAYLVEFNETVHVPRDYTGQLFARSSLWRSGATLSAGIVDAGYEGALGAVLDIKNPCGVVLHQDAKLGQIAFHRLEGKVEGYCGIYQLSKSTLGRDGSS